jgi:hypothetical protein
MTEVATGGKVWAPHSIAKTPPSFRMAWPWLSLLAVTIVVSVWFFTSLVKQHEVIMSSIVKTNTTFTITNPDASIHLIGMSGFFLCWVILSALMIVRLKASVETPILILTFVVLLNVVLPSRLPILLGIDNPDSARISWIEEAMSSEISSVDSTDVGNVFTMSDGGIAVITEKQEDNKTTYTLDKKDSSK